jgi:Polyketide cyclase / dehydrase and lipid transport
MMKSGADPVIDFDGTFTFPVPVEEVWATMARVDCYPSWWSWLREFSVEGSGLEVGSTLHGVVVPPLPYRMRLDVVLDECVPQQLLAAFVHGDLEGAARLTFQVDGTGTLVRATWKIEMMQRAMRLAAKVGYPLLRWGHDRVVNATVDGFRSHLS